MTGLRLSLVIPCYNEAAGLRELVARCVLVFGGRDDVEVILVDNGSKDDTPAILAELVPKHAFLRTVRVDVNQGYGHGILTGLAAATGDVLGWTHADLQTDPNDALIGFSRFLGSATPERLLVKGRRYGRPGSDLVFTWGMAAFESALLRAPLWDVNAQPNLFHRSFYATWQDPPTDFSLDLFVYWQATRAGLTLERFPVRFGARAHGISRWNVNWQAKVKFIQRTVDYSVRLARR